MATALCKELIAAVSDTVEATRSVLRDACDEGYFTENPSSKAPIESDSMHTAECKVGYRFRALKTSETPIEHDATVKSSCITHVTSEETTLLTGYGATAPVIDLTDEVCSDLVGTEIRPGSATDHASDPTSEQSEADPAVPSAEEKEEEETPNQTSTDVDLLEAEKYVKTAPTRWMCKKIRHQAKKRAGMWSVFRSPKRRH